MTGELESNIMIIWVILDHVEDKLKVSTAEMGFVWVVGGSFRTYDVTINSRCTSVKS